MGMGWTVETLGPTVDAEIATLPPKVQAKLLWIMEQIEDRGLPALQLLQRRHVASFALSIASRRFRAGVFRVFF